MGNAPGKTWGEAVVVLTQCSQMVILTEPGVGRVSVLTPGAWLCWIPRRRRVINMDCSNGFWGCLHLPELCNYMARRGVGSKEQPSGWSWIWVLPQVGSSWALLITQGWNHLRAALHTQWAVLLVGIDALYTSGPELSEHSGGQHLLPLYTRKLWTAAERRAIKVKSKYRNSMDCSWGKTKSLSNVVLGSWGGGECCFPWEITTPRISFTEVMGKYKSWAKWRKRKATRNTACLITKSRRSSFRHGLGGIPREARECNVDLVEKDSGRGRGKDSCGGSDQAQTKWRCRTHGNSTATGCWHKELQETHFQLGCECLTPRNEPLSCLHLGIPIALELPVLTTKYIYNAQFKPMYWKCHWVPGVPQNLEPKSLRAP